MSFMCNKHNNKTKLNYFLLAYDNHYQITTFTYTINQLIGLTLLTTSQWFHNGVLKIWQDMWHRIKNVGK